MKIKEAKLLQIQRLRKVCEEQGVDYDFLSELLESVKTKKISKRNHYLQQKINDVIEKTIK